MEQLPPGVPLSQIPALKPPPGVKPNFVDPVSLAPAIIAVNVVFLVLMLIALVMRLYTKGILLRNLWWDDRKTVPHIWPRRVLTQTVDFALIAAVSVSTLRDEWCD